MLKEEEKAYREAYLKAYRKTNIKTLLKYAKNYYSQFGEDGVLEEVFKRLNIKEGWFVDLGAWDGKFLSNTFHLLKKGWKGIDIEGDKDKYKDLLVTAKKFKRLQTIQSYVTTSGKNSLNSLLAKTDLPLDFDLLNIDIDSYDWWIWNSLKKYTPKVIVIEELARVPIHKEYIQPKDISNEKMKREHPFSPIGSSFKSNLLLGRKKGYQLVCHVGANMVFVKNELVRKLKLPENELSNPNSLFQKSNYSKVPYPLVVLLKKIGLFPLGKRIYKFIFYKC